MIIIPYSYSARAAASTPMLKAGRYICLRLCSQAGIFCTSAGASIAKKQNRRATLICRCEKEGHGRRSHLDTQAIGLPPLGPPERRQLLHGVGHHGHAACQHMAGTFWHAPAQYTHSIFARSLHI